MRTFEEFIDKVAGLPNEGFSEQYKIGFSAGVQWYREGRAIDEYGIHVAEVVKCGDVNKSKSNDHPQEWFDAQQKELERHYREDFAEEMLSGNRKNIEDVVTKCKHLSVDLSENAGYMCPKCSKWINGPSI